MDSGTPRQFTLDDLGTPLVDVTFVIVDLETTGGSAADCGITEIGAVKVRGGQVLGEFQTLVNPGHLIPPFIASLTGITNAMVASAPPVAGAMHAFLEFAADSVLVAHNAPFDVGFLRAACAAHSITWPRFTVVDTAKLARQLLHKDEVRNHKLSTLAVWVRSTTEPNHRALSDARATTDVLHGLIDRLGSNGVTSLEDLTTFSSRITAAQSRKRGLAEGLPNSPGVYVFEDAKGEPLYVGTSKHIRQRVRNYFTASENRKRMSDMITLAERVRPIVCATPLEAQVRELRLIVEAQPRYNRRSRKADSVNWVVLSDEPYPRFVVTKKLTPTTAMSSIGPFRNRGAADFVIEGLIQAINLRTCIAKIAARPRTPSSPCVLLDMNRCLAPCLGPQVDVRDDYAQRVETARRVMRGDLQIVHSSIESRMSMLAEQERYEEAATWRDRLTSVLRSVDRSARLAMLADEPELVAAVQDQTGAWDIHVIRHGRLAGAVVCPPGLDPRPAVDAAIAAAEDVPHSGLTGIPAALIEETELILRWLESDGVRLVRSTRGLAQPWVPGIEKIRSIPTGFN